MWPSARTRCVGAATQSAANGGGIDDVSGLVRGGPGEMFRLAGQSARFEVLAQRLADDRRH